MAEEQKKQEWRAEIPEDDGYEEERLRRKWEREQEMKQTQRERRLREQRRRLRALVVLAVTAALLIVLVTVLTVNVFIPLGHYSSAKKLLENGEYAEAIVAFRNMPGYKDADALLSEAIRLQAEKLAGREDVVYATSESAPWFSITEAGELDFDSDDYRGDWNLTVPDVFDGVLVTSLSKKIFAHETKLVSVKISECVLHIGDYAFLGCTGLTSLRLPTHLKTVGVSAFEDCTALQEISFGEALESIGASAFAECTSLREVTLPNGLKALNSRAFNACASLTSITIGGALETLGSYAFSACDALETVRFLGSEAEWNTLCADPERLGLDGVTVVCGGAQE